MPDYNKGDFTQQGIDGFVEGGLHLNEKRCLTAKISTDEQTSGLDSVEINIHDHLNNLDYTITGENLTVGENALPSGNIAITENTPEGETLDIAQYATATVNVSGGGEMSLKHLTVNLVNTYEEPIVIQMGELHLYNFLSITDDLLISTYDSNSDMYQFDLQDVLYSIPTGTTTLIFPYIQYGDSNFYGVAFNSADIINHVTYSNMTYDSENTGLTVTDATENSVITYTPVRSGE